MGVQKELKSFVETEDQQIRRFKKNKNSWQSQILLISEGKNEEVAIILANRDVT